MAENATVRRVDLTRRTRRGQSTTDERQHRDAYRRTVLIRRPKTDGLLDSCKCVVQNLLYRFIGTSDETGESFTIIRAGVKTVARNKGGPKRQPGRNHSLTARNMEIQAIKPGSLGRSKSALLGLFSRVQTRPRGTSALVRLSTRAQTRPDEISAGLAL